MCCFTGPVHDVRNTRIFTRWLPGVAAPRQVLAYQMSYATARDVAMVLPLPVPPGSGEKALDFLNLEKEPEFFDRLHSLFPAAYGGKTPVAYTLDFSRAPAPLAVVKVGSFEASFVPTTADFSRLDPQFRFPDKVWAKLPQYRDWGFAVFKLRKDATTVHPMAFTFPNGRPKDGLFFPTIHIHDGKVHAEEEFDHTLFCQTPPGRHGPPDWTESAALPSSLRRLHDAGLLDRDEHVYRKHLTGKLRNADTWA